METQRQVQTYNKSEVRNIVRGEKTYFNTPLCLLSLISGLSSQSTSLSLTSVISGDSSASLRTESLLQIISTVWLAVTTLQNESCMPQCSFLECLPQCCMKSFEGSTRLFNLIKQLPLQTSLLISRETAVHSINIF